MAKFLRCKTYFDHHNSLSFVLSLGAKLGSAANSLVSLRPYDERALHNAHAWSCGRSLL